ncbi:hypothetical protein BGX28_002115, partial [Mortierella sp. GBA30]
MVRIRSSTNSRGKKTTSKSKAATAAANPASATTQAVPTTSVQGATAPAVPVDDTVQAAPAEIEATPEDAPDNASDDAAPAATDNDVIPALPANEANEASTMRSQEVWDEDSEMSEVSSVMDNGSMISSLDHDDILANAATDLSLDNAPLQIPRSTKESLATNDQERLDRLYDEQEKLTRRMTSILRLHAAPGIVPSEAN